MCVCVRGGGTHSPAAEQDPHMSVHEHAQAALGSPGTLGAVPFSPEQPVLQPEELIPQLSAFAMHTEDAPRPEALWQAGACAVGLCLCQDKL